MTYRYYLLIALLFSAYIQAQNNIRKYVGTYGDWTPNGKALTNKLELHTDGTFTLHSIDNVYPQTFSNHTNKGKWIVKDEQIILNPDLKKRTPIVKLREKRTGKKDSITIKINHYNEVYENETLIEKKPTDFDLLTLYFNKKRKYKTLTRHWYNTGSCAWAPRIKNRVNVDASNTFKIPKEAIETIGIYTYGFTDFVTLKTDNSQSDYYEIDVIIPIDKERMPRHKKVIIKGKRAYFHESNGKVKKSLEPLYKKSV